MRRWLEIGKDLLIVILVLAVLSLTVLSLPDRMLASIPGISSVLGPFAGFFGLNPAELEYTENAAPGLDAAQPLAVSVRSPAGRFSAQYDFSAIDSLYEALGSTLGQALESATEPEETTLQKLYAAMSGTGVTFLYPAALPSGVLASWLGAQPQESGSAAFLYVLSVQESGRVRLYLRGSACWVCDTAISAEALAQALDGYRPDGSFFALEDSTGVYALLDPCSLISVPTPRIFDATSTDPCDTRFVTALASTLGFNPYGDASYTDDAGNSFFSENDATLRVFAGGQLQLNADEDAERFTAASDDPETIIEFTRALLEQILSGTDSDARLYLSEFTQTDSGAVCAFDYVLGGVPILQNGQSHAAAAVFTDGTLTELTFLLRTYRTGTQPLALIPAAQAAAIVPEGSTLRIYYDDSGSGLLSAGWRRG